MSKAGQLLHDQLVQDLEYERRSEMRYREIAIQNPSAFLDGIISDKMKRVIALQDFLQMLRSQEEKSLACDAAREPRNASEG
jgi:hypothetical protein